MLIENVVVTLTVDGEDGGRLELALTTDTKLQDLLYSIQEGHEEVGSECVFAVSYIVKHY